MASMWSLIAFVSRLFWPIFILMLSYYTEKIIILLKIVSQFENWITKVLLIQIEWMLFLESIKKKGFLLLRNV